MAGGRRRSVASMEKDAEALRLHHQGLTYRQIAAERGWRSPAPAHAAAGAAGANPLSPPPPPPRPPRGGGGGPRAAAAGVPRVEGPPPLRRVPIRQGRHPSGDRGAAGG